MFDDTLVLIKGAGDLATGVAARLWRSGFRVVMTELEQPLTIRRTVAFSEAVYAGVTTVEGLTARRVARAADVEAAWREGEIPVWVDPHGRCAADLRPWVVVDAILAKRNLVTRLDEAPLVIGLGPGFTAGVDVHAVVETNRGHYLGRVLWAGSAEPDTGTPGQIGGVGRQRVIRSPVEGVFEHRKAIGDLVEAGEVVGVVGQTPASAQISGVLRGLIHDGVYVVSNIKIGDVDPRGNVEYCWTISDKALAIGGGVLEAIVGRWGKRNRNRAADAATTLPPGP